MAQLILLFALTATAHAQVSGALVETLNRSAGTNNFVFGGTVSPYTWVDNRAYKALDFYVAIDNAPGVGATWTYTLEHAPLITTEECADISSYTSVALCTISGATAKSCSALNVPVNITAPSCIRGRAVITGGSNPGQGGVVSIYPRDTTFDGPMHFMSTTSTGSTSAPFYGNWGQASANHDRSFWISTGSSVKKIGGTAQLTAAPGSGNAWDVKLAYSTTGLTNANNCLSLSYTVTSAVCTISGATQKSCSWDPVDVDVPEKGCVQLRATRTSGSGNITMTVSALDLTTDTKAPYNAGEASYSAAGSGAFDANHVFGIGPWAISDAKAPAGVAFLNQQYWIAPSTGLDACGGAFTFTSALSGTGTLDFGVVASTAAPTVDQSCLDLTYTPTSAFCQMSSGDKSCSFGLSAVTVPPGGCFALNVTSSGGTLSAGTTPWNWQATCRAATVRAPAPLMNMRISR